MRALSLLSVLILSLAVPLAQSSAPPAQTPADVEKRVESLLSQMTLEEKIDLIGGVDGFFIRGVPRLGVPRLKMADGPMGVRNYGPATAMPGGIGLTATWNPALAERVGLEIGRDARAKGVHFLLGPGLNIYRAPLNGRNFEYFGEDPWLAARIAVGYITGVEREGVSATPKHYMGNNSEFDRHRTDSVIDERTMREIYLPAFEGAVKDARAGAIMDAYNLTNGAHMSEQAYLNTQVAKREWGFDGIIMSDWGGTYDAVAAANGGLDLEMPSGRFMNQKNLKPAIEQGKVRVATLDDKVRRILRVAARFGWLDRDQTDLSIPRFNPQGRQVALEAAREAMVLLKNDGPLLPLDKGRTKSIAIIGPNAYPAVPVAGGSGQVEPFAAVSFLEGLSRSMGTAGNVFSHRGLPTLEEMATATSFVTAAENGQPGLRAEYFDNLDLKGAPIVTRTDPRVNIRPSARAAAPEKAVAARWTGFYLPQRAGSHTFFVEASGGRGGGGYRLYLDDTLALDNWEIAKAFVSHLTRPLGTTPVKVVLEHRGGATGLGSRLALGIFRDESVVAADAKAIAAKADAVVVAVGFDPEIEGEGMDRAFGLPPGQDALIREMTAANNSAIVVITSGGSVDMTGWLDRVPALIEAWYPGQEGGTALADLLFGDANPSGRLPVTFERRWDDNPVHDSYYPEPGTNRVVYKEGVFVGYRGYERNGTKPLFPFGYGLSYTTFAYKDLSITPAGAERFDVSFSVTNTGGRAGADVAQVYVHDGHAPVPRPAKELKGFAKMVLQPGEILRVTVTLDRRAFSYYDVGAKQWRAAPGDFEILVGRSSEQIELRGTLSITDAPGLRREHRTSRGSAAGRRVGRLRGAGARISSPCTSDARSSRSWFSSS